MNRVLSATTPKGWGRRLLPLILMAGLALAVAPLTLRAGDPNSAPLCNGHRELCGRPFDQVVFAATHNSMSAADSGYTWPFQDHGIRQQLDDGVRMLLIDSHYWEPQADALKARAKLAPGQVGAFDQATAGDHPEPGAFLCHALCALGETPLQQALTDIRTFLDTHPDEVVGIFLQDAISPADTLAAFDRAGLSHYAYAHPAGQRWPTLGQMIDSGHRLVVFAEVQGPPPAWYMQGWEQVQDTSFSVTAPDAFNCALNRGGTGNSLFLLNHWVSKPVPSVEDAALVNSFGFLMRRARQCERQRGHLPNFIAVNFYDVGDVFRVVNALNRVH